MTEQKTTLPDYADELAELGHEAARSDGPPLKRGEIAALALLGAGEIERLRGWLDYITGNFRDPRECAEAALRGDDAPEGFGR